MPARCMLFSCDIRSTGEPLLLCCDSGELSWWLLTVLTSLKVRELPAVVFTDSLFLV